MERESLLCDLLTAKDDKTVAVVLDVIASILATAKKLNITDRVTIMVDEWPGSSIFKVMTMSKFN